MNRIDAAPVRQHAAHRLLRHQEAAERGHRDRLLDLGRIELGERPARAVARVVDHDLGRADGGVEIGEQLLDVGALGGVARERLGAGLDREVVQIVGRARRQRDLHAVLGSGRGRARRRGRRRRRR